MDKQIKNCTTKEILLNFDQNKHDMNYVKAFEIWQKQSNYDKGE